MRRRAASPRDLHDAADLAVVLEHQRDFDRKRTLVEAEVPDVAERRPLGNPLAPVVHVADFHALDAVDQLALHRRRRERRVHDGPVLAHELAFLQPVDDALSRAARRAGAVRPAGVRELDDRQGVGVAHDRRAETVADRFAHLAAGQRPEIGDDDLHGALHLPQAVEVAFGVYDGNARFGDAAVGDHAHDREDHGGHQDLEQGEAALAGPGAHSTPSSSSSTGSWSSPSSSSSPSPSPSPSDSIPANQSSFACGAAVAMAPTNPESVTIEESSGSSSRRTLTSTRRIPRTWVCDTLLTQCHCRPANSTSPAVSSTEGISPVRRTSVMRLSAIHWAKLRSRSTSTLLTVSPMVLNTASMPMPRIASATTTSMSVNPRESGLGIAALDLYGPVEAADHRDARAAAAHQREPVRRHLAAAPGDELRQARILVALAAQQHRPALQDEFEGEVGREFPGRQGGVPLDGLPPLLEGLETLEFVACRLEEDAVVAALELRLLLQQRDGIREAPHFILDLAVLTEDPDGQRSQHGEDADDDQDDEYLDQRHAARGAAR